MYPVIELLTFERNSRARKFPVLMQEIRDAVIDGWHSPEVIDVCANRTVVTQLECAMDPQLLPFLSMSDAHAGMAVLVQWLRDKGVEYVIAYKVTHSRQSANSKGHSLALKFLLRTHVSLGLQ